MLDTESSLLFLWIPAFAGMTVEGDIFKVKDKVEEEIKKNAIEGKLPCSIARTIAEDLGISYKIVGNAADRLKIKITNCQLGCF